MRLETDKEPAVCRLLAMPLARTGASDAGVPILFGSEMVTVEGLLDEREAIAAVLAR